jgi:outer membrane protein OmpA-like peptidoglycan-associated protein
VLYALKELCRTGLLASLALACCAGGAEEAPAEHPPRFVAITESRDYVLLPVHFNKGSAMVLADSAPILDQMARALERETSWLVEVEGHADIDEEPGALELSRLRAAAVREALIARGVAPGALRAAGYGVYCPWAQAGLPQNRRVQFTVSRSEDGPGKTPGCPAAEAHGLRGKVDP